MRSLLLAVALLCQVVGFAQADSSLTREFVHLSAKERARIAKQEQEEAAADEGYQTVMAQAEDLFRMQRYDDALVRFQEARNLRPLNVYPKVKIQDLQALIAKREAAKAAAEVETAQEAPMPAIPTPMSAARDTVVRAQPEPVPIVGSRSAVDVAPEQKRTIPVAVKPRPETVHAPIPSEGTHERTYVEGRAIVFERTVVRGKRVEVYRKVTHPYGQVVHFRDGIAISEREWKEAFREH